MEDQTEGISTNVKKNYKEIKNRCETFWDSEISFGVSNVQITLLGAIQNRREIVKIEITVYNSPNWRRHVILKRTLNIRDN